MSFTSKYNFIKNRKVYAILLVTFIYLFIYVSDNSFLYPDYAGWSRLESWPYVRIPTFGIITSYVEACFESVPKKIFLLYFHLQYLYCFYNNSK